MKLSRIVTGFLSLALLAFMVTETLAQEGQRRGDRGDRGGRPGGGFQRGGPPGGGGFRPGGGRPGGGDPTLMLLGIEEVQTELQIDPDQKAALAKLREQARPERPNLDFGSMTEDERREAFEKMQKQREQRNAELKEQLIEVLLPEQMERLEQIVLQVQGVRALANDEVAGRLGMTDEQKKKLGEVREQLQQEMGPKMRELFASGDREAVREGMRKVGEEMQEKVLAVLTSDQRKQFDEMKGEKFEMPERFGRGGFAGRGGPGGGRGGFGGPRGGPGGRRPGGQEGGGRRPRPETEE